MTKRGEEMLRSHSAHRLYRQQHLDSAKTHQKQQQVEVQKQRRYYSAHGPREQLESLRSKNRQLQAYSQPAHSLPLQSPSSSVYPPQQIQQRENPSHEQCNSLGRPNTSVAVACSAVAPVVLFDVSKKERGDPSNTYRSLARQLQEDQVQIEVNSEGSLTPEKLRHVSLVVLAHPSQPFSSSEVKALREFLSSGKSVLAMLGEGGEKQAKTNINYFLEEYGMTICSDTVVRTVVAAPAHLHPKETLIADGFLSEIPARQVHQENIASPTNNSSSRRGSENCSRRGRSVENCTHPSSSLNSSPSTSSGINTDHNGTNTPHLSNASIPGSSSSGSSSYSSQCVGELLEEISISFLFPYGATVSVQPPAFPFLSSGLIAFPPRRPLGAAYVDPSSDGRLVALGSYRMFDDTFLHKENNKQLQHLIFAWLLHQQPAEALHPRQSLDPASCNGDDSNRSAATGDHKVEADLAERSQPVPHTASMAERVMPCFQESEHCLPPDFHDLHEEKLYSVNLDMLPEVKRVYKQLNVKFEPLSMIVPEFEVPLPRYVPAVHPPLRMDLSPPPLELFDLDEELASPRTRLAHLTNRCTDAAVAYYIREAAHIVGFPQTGPDSEVGDEKSEEEIAKRLLWRVFAEIAAYKNQHGSATGVTRRLKESNTISTPKSSVRQV